MYIFSYCVFRLSSFFMIQNQTITVCIWYTVGFMKRVCSVYTLYIFTIYQSLYTQSERGTKKGKCKNAKIENIFVEK